MFRVQGYMASQNATTIWEHWEYMNGPGMNSHAHPALASVGAWLYRWVAGLRLDDGTLAAPNANYGQGWKKILFAPGFVTDPRLPSAQARVTSVYGPIGVSWAYASGRLSMRIDVPIDVTARVMVPTVVGGGALQVTVSEGGTDIWSHGKAAAPGLPGITAAVVDGHVTLAIGSGSYVFAAH
jgi:alpha-L-rhamnosidase